MALTGAFFSAIFWPWIRDSYLAKRPQINVLLQYTDEPNNMRTYVINIANDGETIDRNIRIQFHLADFGHVNFVHMFTNRLTMIEAGDNYGVFLVKELMPQEQQSVKVSVMSKIGQKLPEIDSIDAWSETQGRAKISGPLEVIYDPAIRPATVTTINHGPPIDKEWRVFLEFPTEAPPPTAQVTPPDDNSPESRFRGTTVQIHYPASEPASGPLQDRKIRIYNVNR